MASSNEDFDLPEVRLLPAGDYPRKHARYAVELRVTLQVLIQEDTFALQEIHARTMDLSERGMRIAIGRLDGEFYTKLLKESRQVRIFFKHPVTEEKLKLVGRLAWIDYHKAHADETSGPCFMGVLLDGLAGTDLDKYVELVQTLEKRALGNA